MSPHRASSRQTLSPWLCLIAALWTIPERSYSAQAREFQRPDVANDNLSVRVEEASAQLSPNETTYEITFENLSDQEVAYDDLALRFPELAVQPIVWTPGQDSPPPNADEPRKRNRRPHVHATPYDSSPHLAHCGGSKTCGVYILLFVLLIVVVVVVGITQSQRAKRDDLAEEAAEAKRGDIFAERKIQLLRGQTTVRQFRIRNSDIKAKTLLRIELTDSKQARRMFQTTLSPPGL